MARPFSAPIPVYRKFYLPRDVGDRDIAALLYALGWKVRTDAEWRDVFARWFLLQGIGPDSQDFRAAKPFLRSLTQTWRLGDLILAVRDLALTIGSLGNALAVDDHFIGYIDPDSAEAFMAEWLKVAEERARLGGSKARILATGMETPPCLHAKEHSEILEGRRGPKRSPQRRAATWGTYIIAWLLGSEGLAVRLWNILLPAQYRWGSDPAPLEYALKKYVTAKARLVKDLMEWCARRTVNPDSHLRPYPPLDPHLSQMLEQLIYRYAQGEALGVDLSDDSQRLALVFPPPSAFSTPLPRRESDPPEHEEDRS